MEEPHKDASTGAAHAEKREGQIAEQFARVMKTEHWLKSYMTDLLGAHALGNGLDFQTAELLLKQERESFEADLMLAQKMYKMYPHLFRQESEAAKPA